MAFSFKGNENRMNCNTYRPIYLKTTLFFALKDALRPQVMGNLLILLLLIGFDLDSVLFLLRFWGFPNFVTLGLLHFGRASLGLYNLFALQT